MRNGLLKSIIGVYNNSNYVGIFYRNSVSFESNSLIGIRSKLSRGPRCCDSLPNSGSTRGASRRGGGGAGGGDDAPRRSKLGTSNPGGRPGHYLSSRRLSACAFVTVAVSLFRIFRKKNRSLLPSATCRGRSEILRFRSDWPRVQMRFCNLLSCGCLRIYTSIRLGRWLRKAPRATFVLPL